MNRISTTGLLRVNSSFAQRREILTFGIWWNGDAGIYRRIRGQGPLQHKKHDYLNFKDRPDIQKTYPYLHSFILRRQRDQGKI